MAQKYCFNKAKVRVVQRFECPMKKNVDKQCEHWRRRHPIRVYIVFTVFMCAAARQNQQYSQCAQRRRRSVWASAQSDQSSLCAQWVANDPVLLHADSEDSDQAGRILLVLSCCGAFD